ncbi:uncharacterized protein UDID_17160 [Ustilago sp. UG-2017a]|nr:uncharacterized protein UDID_17160 [Ustilago sp. UG-2017a]
MAFCPYKDMARRMCGNNIFAFYAPTIGPVYSQHRWQGTKLKDVEVNQTLRSQSASLSRFWFTVTLTAII